MGILAKAGGFRKRMLSCMKAHISNEHSLANNTPRAVVYITFTNLFRRESVVVVGESGKIESVMNKEKVCFVHVGNKYGKCQTKKDGVECWRCTVQTCKRSTKLAGGSRH